MSRPVVDTRLALRGSGEMDRGVRHFQLALGTAARDGLDGVAIAVAGEEILVGVDPGRIEAQHGSTRLRSSTNLPQSSAEMKRRLPTLLAMEIWSAAALRLAASSNWTALRPWSESWCSSQAWTKASAGP